MDIGRQGGFGAFELQERIGLGGMAEVWRATHRLTGSPVAIKLIRPDAIEVAAQRRALLSEARTLARVHHRNVVSILDCGLTPAGETAERVYIVMELADGGAMQPTEVTDWATCRRIALDVLDGLAHVHARGIVHRDLKPGNILRFAAGQRWTYRIADFGLAVKGGETPNEGDVSGTPEYMAPEQVHGMNRELGPWSDLYALGCVIWKITTGTPPFQLPSATATMLAHMTTPPPAFVPSIPVPVGLQAWLRRLLAKHPMDRFGCAADCANALLELDTARVSPGDDTERRGSTLGVLEDTLVDSSRPVVPASATPVGTVPQQAPPFPASWQRDARPTTDRLADVGLGLFALREPPLVGRSDERNVLWGVLRRAVIDGQSHAVEISGAGGVGKTTLGQWLIVRSAELGQARALLVRHDGHLGWHHAVAAACDDVLSIRGLDDEAQRVQLQARLGPLKDRVVEDLVNLVERPDTFVEPRAAFDCLEALFRGLGRDCPVIVMFDACEHATFGLELAEHWSQLDDSPPVLFLFTVDLDRANPFVRTRLPDIDAVPVRLKPLREPQRRQQIAALLPLSDDSVGQLTTMDSSLDFARQVLSLLIERGELEPTSSGFALPASWSPPGSIAEVWRERLSSLSERNAWTNDAVVDVVTALCSVGARADEELFSMVADALDIEVPAGAFEGLESLGAVSGSPIRRVDRSLWRAGAQLAADDGVRSAECHAVLAQHFEQRGSRTALVRAAYHHQHSGDLLAAAAAVRSAVQMSMARDGEPLQLWIESMLGDTSEPHLLEELALSRINLALHEIHAGELERAEARLAAAAADIGDKAPIELQAELISALGTLDLFCERFNEGLTRALAAAELFDAVGSSEVHNARALVGDLYFFSGDLAGAEPYYRAVLDAARSGEGRLGWALYRMGSLHDEWGHSDTARVMYQEAKSRFEELGDENGRMLVIELLADLAYKAGDFHQTEMLLLEAMAIAEAARDRTNFAHAGLGRLYAEMGRAADALPLLAEVVALTDRVGTSVHRPIVRDAMAEALAHDGNWDAFEPMFERAVSEIRSGQPHVDHAETFERIANLAQGAGRSSIAERAARAAEEQRAKLR